MGNRRRDKWEEDYELYSPGQIEGILEFCHIEVVSDTQTHFLCYCPFHGNTDSPALAVDKYKGLWTCFNPSCYLSGDLTELVKKRNKTMSLFQVYRLILKYKNFESESAYERMQKALEPKEFPSMSDEKIESLHEALWDSPALEYMRGRGFDDDTLKQYQVGYSPARVYPPPYKSRPEMVVVPMRDLSGKCIGVVGRSIVDKVFKNSTGLPKTETAWNIHNARRFGGTVIVCESTFDAMRVSQSGYPNVIALLGGTASVPILNQINRHFDKVIIMTDFDKKQYHPNCRRCDYKTCKGHRPGRDLGRAIALGLPNKKIMWAAYDDNCVYPHDAKDAGDMTDQEIVKCLRNAVSNLEYTQWNIEESVAV